MPDYQKLAKELKKNTEVMEAMLKACGLQILSFSFQPFGDDDADCILIMELSTDGKKKFKGAELKVNLYDEDGEIFVNKSTTIYSWSFIGYDTEKIALCYGKKALLKAKRARIFATPE